MKYTTHNCPSIDLGDTHTVRVRTVFLHVTKACNLHCRYCYFSARKPLSDEMTTDELACLWPQLVELRPEKVVFTGGEPLLRPDIVDLLRGMRVSDPGHHVLRCLNSNGHLVRPELARSLVGLADEVRISLDALAERNDLLRGQGNFEAAIRALECYYAVGFEPKVLVTISSLTFPDLEDLICLLAKKDITRINFNILRPIGRGQGHPEWQTDAAEVRAAFRRAWRRCYPDQPVPEEPCKPETQTHCGAGQFLNIMPNGDVFPCHVLTDPEFRCGSVREQSLLEICRQSGLLDQLASLDFREVAHQDQQVESLSRAGTCMGTVYAQTKASSAWRTSLPLLGVQRSPSEPSSRRSPAE